ncbi:hypothetical protein PG994_001407 [Apiospora phragmitis]|uniref:Uncharacterized protein n=1 Tax=Apiospora phragmitis TaxID=2905665 RepID=A0ABR1WTE3_9PEZI
MLLTFKSATQWTLAVKIQATPPISTIKNGGHDIAISPVVKHSPEASRWHRATRRPWMCDGLALGPANASGSRYHGANFV